MITRILLTAALAAVSLAASSQPAEAAVCRKGDPPLTVSSRTSCAFAGNVVNQWMNGDRGPRTDARLLVKSPTTRKYYTVHCIYRGPLGSTGKSVVCKGPNGISIRFRDWNR
jgi:hypothetical protein